MIILVLFRACSALGNISTSTSKSNSQKFYSYSSVVKNFAKALTKADGEKLVQTMLTSDMIDYVGDNYSKELSESFASTNEILKEIYNKKPKYSMSVKNKTKLSSDRIQEIEYYYSYYYHADVKITKGYSLEVKLKCCGETDTVYFDVVNIKNDGWKIEPTALKSILGIY